MLRYWHHHGRTRASKDPIKHALAWLTDELPKVTVAEFDRTRQQGLIAAMKAKGLRASSIARYMGAIRSSLKWAETHGELPATAPLAMPEREEEHGVAPYSLEEMRAVLEACVTPMERLMVLIWVATACRPHQAVDLTWDRVGPFAIDFRVPGARLTKKRRAVSPIAPTVSAYLEAHRSLGPVIRSEKRKKVTVPIKEWKKKFQRIADRAGVSRAGYRVRKFTATYLRNEARVPLDEIAAMLGHKDPAGGRETWRYAIHSQDFMPATREGIEAMVRNLSPSWLASYWQVPTANQLFPKAANDD